MMTTENTTVAPVLTLAERLQALAALQAEQRAKAASGTPVAVAQTASRAKDAFGAPAHTGTWAMHHVLAAAYAAGALLTRKQIAAEITAMGLSRPVDQHISTMSGKGRITLYGTAGLRLSDAAGQLLHGEGKMFGFASQPAAEAPPASVEAPPVADQPAEVTQPV